MTILLKEYLHFTAYLIPNQKKKTALNQRLVGGSQG